MRKDAESENCEEYRGKTVVNCSCDSVRGSLKVFGASSSYKATGVVSMDGRNISLVSNELRGTL